MNPLARQLAELKYAMQELESAVQQPHDEAFGIQMVLDRFPEVMILICGILNDALRSQGYKPESLVKTISRAHEMGWLKGDKNLWYRLLDDSHQVSMGLMNEPGSRAIAQDVRACSWMLWETYELLNARFRWQTQVQISRAPQPTMPAQAYAQQ